MFAPRLALASLSGESDARWARRGAEHAGAAFLGGIALDEKTRDAARALVARDRTEFLPSDPMAFVDRELRSLESVHVRPGVNVRSVTLAPIRTIAAICRDHDAILEINAHCRQDEMCAIGCGEALLRDTSRLCEQVGVAAETGASVSVKVRAEVPGVDLAETARRVAEAGAECIHVDAMDSEPVVADVVEAADLFVIANNGVRDAASVREYLEFGADAVSVGRASDRPSVLAQVRRSADDFFTREVHP